MTTIQALQDRFGIEGQARIEPGAGGLPRILITHKLAEGAIYLHGAHISRYTPTNQSNVLFMSAKSLFAPEKAIRGGVPICFPWFGPRENHPQSPMHGFARLMNWQLQSITPTSQGISTVLTLSSDPNTRKLWDHDFELRYTVTIGRTLQMDLQTTNCGQTPMVFGEALHTYLRISDVRQASVEGLSGTQFIDKTDAMAIKTQGGAPLRITSETDRVYLNTQGICTVHDPLARRRIVVRKEQSNNTVIWNPWIDKARAMADFGDDEWTGMLCVESVNTGQYAVELEPGQSHTMSAILHSIQED